jgi:hypothetical protein
LRVRPAQTATPTPSRSLSWSLSSAPTAVPVRRRTRTPSDLPRVNTHGRPRTVARTVGKSVGSNSRRVHGRVQGTPTVRLDAPGSCRGQPGQSDTPVAHLRRSGPRACHLSLLGLLRLSPCATKGFPSTQGAPRLSEQRPKIHQDKRDNPEHREDHCCDRGTVHPIQLSRIKAPPRLPPKGGLYHHQRTHRKHGLYATSPRSVVPGSVSFMAVHDRPERFI